MLPALQTGNAETLTRWAHSLTLPSDRVTFFNFLASHDGIGLNPACGILNDAEIDAPVARILEHGGFIPYKSLPNASRLPYEMNINYLGALSNPAANEPVELAARKFHTAQAILLSLQGMPGIFFHSLFGSRGDRAAAETSGIPRRINREKLERARPEAELADATSLRSRVFGGSANSCNCAEPTLPLRLPHPNACWTLIRASSPCCAKRRLAMIASSVCTTSAVRRCSLPRLGRAPQT